jgi:hypothetical protein
VLYQFSNLLDFKGNLLAKLMKYLPTTSSPLLESVNEKGVHGLIEGLKRNATFSRKRTSFEIILSMFLMSSFINTLITIFFNSEIFPFFHSFYMKSA